jgi:uncharacterized membrane protein YhaH (DUF805 family)
MSASHLIQRNDAESFVFRLYQYTPSLYAAGISVAVFLALAAVHVWRLHHARAYYFTAFTIGGACKLSALFHPCMSPTLLLIQTGLVNDQQSKHLGMLGEYGPTMMSKPSAALSSRPSSSSSPRRCMPLLFT